MSVSGVGFEYDPGVKPTEFNLEAGGLEYNDYDNKLYTINCKKRLIQLAGTGNDIDNGTTGFKNRVVNGDFAVWQTGEDWNVVGGDVFFAADMFKIANNTDGEYHVWKARTPTENSLRVDVTSEANLNNDDYFLGTSYKMEAMDCRDLNGGYIAVSFMIETNFDGVLSWSLRNHDLTRSYVSTFQVYTGWNTIKKTVRLEMDSILSNDNEIGLFFSIGTDGVGKHFTNVVGEWQDGHFIGVEDTTHYTETVGNYIKFACFQVEKGKVATNFERLLVSDQHNRCLRYYAEYVAEECATRPYRDCSTTDGFRIGAVVQFPTIMRVTPTVTAVGGGYENCTSQIINAGPLGFTHKVKTTAVGRYRIGLDVTHYVDARM